MYTASDTWIELKRHISGDLSEDFNSCIIQGLKDFDGDLTPIIEFFWNFVKEVGLKVHPDFFSDYRSGDGFQVLDESGKLTYYSFNIAKLLKYDTDFVLSRPFNELFERDPFVTKRVMDTFVHMVRTSTRDVYNLSGIPKHNVIQIGFPNEAFSVLFKKAYPVYLHDGRFYGFVLRLDVEKVAHG